MRRLPIVGALAVLLALAFAASAHACSCAPLAPGEALRESDAAIVGRLVEVVPAGRFRADYRYEVERVFRGEREIEAGRVLAVRSARRSAACALPRRLDRDYGLFLTRAGGHWVSGICAVVEPRRLRFAAQHRQLAAERSSSSPGSGDCPA